MDLGLSANSNYLFWMTWRGMLFKCCCNSFIRDETFGLDGAGNQTVKLPLRAIPMKYAKYVIDVK